MRERHGSQTSPSVPHTWPTTSDRARAVDALADLFAWYAKRAPSPDNDTTKEPHERGERGER